MMLSRKKKEYQQNYKLTYLKNNNRIYQMIQTIIVITKKEKHFGVTVTFDTTQYLVYFTT